MRTTLTLSDALLREARKLAASTHRTLKDVVNEALRLGLTLQRPVRNRGYRFNPPGVSGRLLPGVRLDDRDALFDLLDEPRHRK